MNITKTRNGDVLVIALEGRLDTMTAPELEKELQACLDGVKELILDFSKLDYISSAGLRVVQYANRSMASQGAMKIIHVNELVNEVFHITGFSDVLTIE